MTLLLRERDVCALLTMPLALEAVEESFKRQAAGQAILHPRRRIEIRGKAFLHYMAAADTASGYMGLKVYTWVQATLRFLVHLYSVQTGDLLALMEADYLGQVRTGAASGVAAKYLARADARMAAVIGTGGQARTQLEAVCAVRKIESVRAFGRNAEHRARFCAGMSARLKLPVTPAASAEEAVRDADIVITATTASKPVVQGAWLAAGAHVNAIGANFPQKRELDDEAVARADIIAVDSLEQSKYEAGDLIQAFRGAPEKWSSVCELGKIVTGARPGRRNASEITLFKSNGIALWDLAVAGRVYELAMQKGMGERLALCDERTAQRG